MQNKEPSLPLHVILTREMFSVFFKLETPVNGFSEELEVEDVREWFRVRGAKEDMVEKALDQCWNFMRAEVLIEHPKEITTIKLPYAPDI